MDHTRIESEARFEAYVEALVGVIGHADRVEPLHDYCAGLLLPIARKSVEPLAAVTAPARVSAKHQSLLHFVGQAPWSDDRVLSTVCTLVLPALERSGPITAWIVDDTGFPKKGRHSVGVARQYCGEGGKRDNCQVAVTLSLSNAAASLPIAHRPYLPEAWAKDVARRGSRRVCRRMLCSRPSPRSRSTRSRRPMAPAWSAASSWPTLPMATTPGSEAVLRRSAIAHVRRARHDQRLAAWTGASGAEALGRARPPGLAIASRPGPSANFGQVLGDGLERPGLEKRDLAGRNERSARSALCGPARGSCYGLRCG